jgi:hypothetical protein
MQTYNFQRGKCEAEQAAVTECAARVVRFGVHMSSDFNPTINLHV